MDGHRSGGLQDTSDRQRHKLFFVYFVCFVVLNFHDR